LIQDGRSASVGRGSSRSSNVISADSFPPLLPVSGTVTSILTHGFEEVFTVSRAVIRPSEKRVEALRELAADQDRSTRGTIRGRSSPARWRLIEAIADYQLLFAPPAPCIFVTLTHGKDYPDWEESKTAFKRFRDDLRSWLAKRPLDLAGFYVPELQRRGAPHYHLLLRVFGDVEGLDELCGVDRSRWEKSRAGRDDGYIGYKWRELTGDEGSEAKHRKRYAVAIEDVDEAPDRVGRYLIKQLGAELAKRAQMPVEERQKTGRTWGVINKERMRPFYQVPVVTPTLEGARRLGAINDVARKLLGVKLGSVDVLDESTGEVRTYAPQRTRWTGRLGEYLRTGDAVYLYQSVESRRGSRKVDEILTVWRLRPGAIRSALVELSVLSLARGGGGVQIEPSGADPPADQFLVNCRDCGRVQNFLVEGQCWVCGGLSK